MPLLRSTKTDNHLVNGRQRSSGYRIRLYCISVHSFGYNWSLAGKSDHATLAGSSNVQREFIRNRELNMNKGNRFALFAVGLYLAALGLAWIWLHPVLRGREGPRSHLTWCSCL